MPTRLNFDIGLKVAYIVMKNEGMKVVKVMKNGYIFIRFQTGMICVFETKSGVGSCILNPEGSPEMNN